MSYFRLSVYYTYTKLADVESVSVSHIDWRLCVTRVSWPRLRVNGLSNDNARRFDSSHYYEDTSSIYTHTHALWSEDNRVLRQSKQRATCCCERRETFRDFLLYTPARRVDDVLVMLPLIILFIMTLFVPVRIYTVGRWKKKKPDNLLFQRSSRRTR